MLEIPCEQCGQVFTRQRGRGKPAKVCSDECKRLRNNRLMRERYAWDEKYRANALRKRGVCSVCGQPMHVGTGSLPEGERVCRDCGRRAPR